MKHFFIFLLPLLIASFACKRSDTNTSNLPDTSVEIPAKETENKDKTDNEDNISVVTSINEGAFIQYISWENVVRFRDDNTFILYAGDIRTGEDEEYNGTYSQDIQDNITFLDIRFTDGREDRWLLLGNGTLCDIYKSDGSHIHGVTGSVNRTEIIGSASGDKASSYLVENDTSYSPSNLGIHSKTDKPWVEGVEGYGIGEKIFFENRWLSAPAMNISIGYVSYNKPYLYNQNSRPKKIRLSVENKFSFDVDLKDTPHYQEIKFPSDIMLDDKLILEILEVYPGTKYEDTCINTVFFEMNSGYYRYNDFWEWDKKDNKPGLLETSNKQE